MQKATKKKEKKVGATAFEVAASSDHCSSFPPETKDTKQLEFVETTVCGWRNVPYKDTCKSQGKQKQIFNISWLLEKHKTEKHGKAWVSG